MEYYDPMEMKCPWCRRPSRPGFGGPPRPGFGPPPPSPPRPGYGPGPGGSSGPPPRPGFGPPPPPPPPGPGPGGPNRPRPCTRCIRPFEAEEVWQAPSPEQSPAPQSQDSLFQEDEPSTPLTRYYEDDYETEQDLERMKNLYPEISGPEPGPPPDFPDLRAGEGTVPAPGRGGQR